MLIIVEDRNMNIIPFTDFWLCKMFYVIHNTWIELKILYFLYDLISLLFNSKLPHVSLNNLAKFINGIHSPVNWTSWLCAQQSSINWEYIFTLWKSTFKFWAFCVCFFDRSWMYPDVEIMLIAPIKTKCFSLLNGLYQLK